MNGEFDFDNIINNFDNIDDLLNSYKADSEEHGAQPENAQNDTIQDKALPDNAYSESTYNENGTVLTHDDSSAEQGADVSDDSDSRNSSGEEFDPRFNLDRRADGSRRREYSYGGHRVSTSQDLHYEQKASPDYEELRSSYGENEGYEFDKQLGFTQPEEPPKPGKLKNPFRKKKKEEPYVSPVADGDDSRLNQADEPDRPKYPEQIPEDDEGIPSDQKKKHGLFSIFSKKRKDPEMDELDEDYAGAYSKEDAYIPAPSFGSYLSSRIAAVFLRIRGGVPEEGSLGSAYAETEFMGEELQPMAASRYYGSHVFSLRFRTRIALVLTVLSFWLSLGAPSPGMLSELRVATAACLAMEFTVMLLALDVVTNAILNCFRGKFGADFLVVLSCIFSALDALTVLNGSGSGSHIPLCAISSLSLCGVLMSSLLSARAMRKALRVPAIGKKKYAVTTELNITGKDITILKSGKPVTGFVRRMEEAPLDEMLYGKFSVFLALFILFLALIIAAVKRSFSRLLFIYSMLICTSVPFTALLCFALPFFMGSMKLFGNGAALAGWSGVCELGHSHNLIVTDTDIFPEETISIENVRIFADYDPEKVIVYASSLIQKSGCGLVPVFNGLMEENGYSPVSVDNLEYLSGGGIKGMAEGHVLILGGLDLMRLMNIRVPYRLVTATSALLSIDGVLYGIFNISYKADPHVRKALVSLMRSSRNPVFAIRDFNVTPELIRDKFDIATDGYDFPPYADRFRISEAKPSGESQISGVVCREGLGALTDLADTARKIYCVSRICVAFSLFSAVVGAIYAFIHILASGSLPLSSVLIFLLFFNIPVLVLGFITNLFE